MSFLQTTLLINDTDVSKKEISIFMFQEKVEIRSFTFSKDTREYPSTIQGMIMKRETSH